MVDPNYEEIKVYAQNKGKYYALVEVAVLAQRIPSAFIEDHLEFGAGQQKKAAKYDADLQTKIYHE